MAGTIKLRVVQGPLAGQELVFDRPSRCVIGRSSDCDLALPSTEECRCISRHHCMLWIEPPEVRLRDLGSRNGTYVNDQRLDWLPASMDGDDDLGIDCLLESGDEIRVGNLVFQVQIERTMAHAETAGV